MPRLLRATTTAFSHLVAVLALLDCRATARYEEWKTATATYTKEPSGFVATGGACGYGDLRKAGYVRAAGVSTPLFDRGSTCGGCFELRCVDHILWCLQGSPSTVVTVTDFCPPNYGLPGDYGGWCNHPREHFEMSESAFAEIAETQADIVPVQYRRLVEATEPVAPCFTLSELREEGKDEVRRGRELPLLPGPDHQRGLGWPSRGRQSEGVEDGMDPHGKELGAELAVQCGPGRPAPFLRGDHQQGKNGDLLRCCSGQLAVWTDIPREAVPAVINKITRRRPDSFSLAQEQLRPK